MNRLPFFNQGASMIRNMLLIVVLMLAVSHMAKADFIEVDNLYLETEKTFGSNRGYYIPAGEVPRYNLNAGLDMVDGLGILYSESKISSTVGDSQFRYVAIDTEFGLNTTLGVQVYIKHYSGHMLDAVSEDRFPQENSIGIRFHLIGK